MRLSTSSNRNPETTTTVPPAMSANQAKPLRATNSTSPVRPIIPPETTRLDRIVAERGSMGL